MYICVKTRRETMYTCVYVYLCLCMYIHAHTHRHAQRLRSLRALAVVIAASPREMFAAVRSSAFRVVVDACLPSAAMGKRAAGGSAAKRGRDGVAKDDDKTKYPRGVTLWKLFVKSSLRSWPDENGSMLLTERKSPAAYFTGAKVKEIASSRDLLVRLEAGDGRELDRSFPGGLRSGHGRHAAHG